MVLDGHLREPDEGPAALPAGASDTGRLIQSTVDQE
jgi:hypothetical protein